MNHIKTFLINGFSASATQELHLFTRELVDFAVTSELPGSAAV